MEIINDKYTTTVIDNDVTTVTKWGKTTMPRTFVKHNNGPWREELAIEIPEALPRITDVIDAINKAKKQYRQ